MKSTRPTILIVTTVVFLLVVCALVFGVRQVISEAATLDTQIAALQQDQAQQTQLNRLKKVITETDADRQQLAQYYIQSQSDSIDFLNYIERISADLGVTLETRGASEVEVGSSNRLEVKYDVSSSRAGVERFIAVLENIPFVSELTELSIEVEDDGTWQAIIVIQVVVLDHET